MIIGLAGYARSGKDTVAALMKGYERRAFADEIRSCLMALNPLVATNEHLAEVVKRQGWDAAKVTSPEIRRLLQVMGTEVGREMIHPDLWVQLAIKDLESGDKVIFTDVRFVNEAKAIKRLGGSIWRVNRPGVEALNLHPSETSMDHFGYDLIINNYGTLEELKLQLPVME